VLQLNQEMKVLRDAIAGQQTLLNEILAQVQRPAGVAGSADPSAPAPPPSAAGGNSIPASPTDYYRAANQYFFLGQYDNAIAALTAAIQKYPESPEAASAQMRIGESYDALHGHDTEALAAFDLVIKNYKDPDVVSDAYYKKDAAGKVLLDLRRLYPTSSAADLALPVLKQLGIIK
jgi:TolA-binding protein